MPAERSPELDRAHLTAWDDVLDESSYYEILGILHIADSGAIREAFHEFALAFHPDAQLDLGPHERQMVQRIFQRGVEAYRVLSTDEQRAAYDLKLAQGLLRMEAPSVREETGARSLDEVCVSAAAKLHAKRAEAFITHGELGRAADELLRALRAEEGANPELAERLHSLNTLVRLGSGPGRT
ncbi:MAG TPA: DnaJ domain-containing protein [Polyangiaceae bacterium]|nr:DnaJ domain-containing protein [Polyangiaceae bacterium]